MNQLLSEDMKTLVYEIHPQEEKEYVTLPFTVDEATDRLDVSYSFTGKDDGAVIDLGIEDPYQFCGWSGGACDHFVISEREATPEYKRGRLHCGVWNIILGAYRVPHICKVFVTIKQQRTDVPVWLKGDLHMHTEHSDGSFTIEDTFRIAKKKGLILLLQPTTIRLRKNRCGFWHDGVMVIPGVEWSTYKGHANILGGQEPLESFRIRTDQKATELMNAVKKRGDVWIVNHPFDDGCPWEWPHHLQAVEVWNGPWRLINEKASGFLVARTVGSWQRDYGYWRK
ncbi:CehA/McbA family metallohydrolase [Aureibacillus halotolerans]|uniref:Uncharacterized protein n=1 Tax=Aureibacillus halotolerans TaxID=1508390 RepID=A0A4R6U457_9BACI|nr:CehA/McbA family metallohydrolase [Aureibacillus halotolerans]TDQ41230.1 hypothetical protein EV213_104228 [Aureibacillus halotolerans]